ncbi:MAG: hypothetical protein AABW56_02685 [Nanoarchaeota archaeon]
MVNVSLKNVYDEVKLLKKDIALIKYILSEEGQLTEETKRRLEIARKTPDSKYLEL